MNQIQDNDCTASVRQINIAAIAARLVTEFELAGAREVAQARYDSCKNSTSQSYWGEIIEVLASRK